MKRSWLKRKPNTKAKLRIQADRLWFQICLEKYDSKCEICRNPAVQVHHFFPKGLYPQLRYVICNGIPICQADHFRHHTLGDPIVHQIIISKRGKDWWEKLKLISKELSPSYKSISYYNDIIKELEDKKTANYLGTKQKRK